MSEAAQRQIDNLNTLLAEARVDRDNVYRANASLREDLVLVRGTNADLVSAVTELERKVQILEGESTPSMDAARVEVNIELAEELRGAQATIERLRSELDRARGARIELESKARRREADVSSLVARATTASQTITRLTDKAAQFRAHSVIANAAGWKLAGMLGLRPPGDAGPVEVPGLLELVDLLEQRCATVVDDLGGIIHRANLATRAMPGQEPEPKALRPVERHPGSVTISPVSLVES